jgi:hypothetical protein
MAQREWKSSIERVRYKEIPSCQLHRDGPLTCRHSSSPPSTRTDIPVRLFEFPKGPDRMSLSKAEALARDVANWRLQEVCPVLRFSSIGGLTDGEMCSILRVCISHHDRWMLDIDVEQSILLRVLRKPSFAFTHPHRPGLTCLLVQGILRPHNDGQRGPPVLNHRPN